MRGARSYGFALVLGLAAGALLAASCGERFEADEGTAGATPTTSTTNSTAGGGGTTTSSTSGEGGTECSGFGVACYECGRDGCEELYCGCVTNEACMGLALCVDGCAPDSLSCLQDCYAAGGEYVATAALLSDCLATTCSSDCPNYEPLSDCRRCMFQSCPSEMNACLASVPCTQLLYCAEDCETPACVVGCYDANSEGAPLAEQVQVCLNGACLDECPWGVYPDGGIMDGGSGEG